MIEYAKTPPKPCLPKSWRRAVESLDRALEKNAPRDNRELIELFGRQHFGDSWKPRPLPGEPPSNHPSTPKPNQA